MGLDKLEISPNGRIVAQLWEDYATVVLADVPAYQYVEMKKAFYTGVNCLLKFQHNCLGALDEQTGVAVLESMVQEIETFFSSWEGRPNR